MLFFCFFLMTLRLLQIGYTSEWALAKFFPVILNGYNPGFELIGICGREPEKDDAEKRLVSKIDEKENANKEERNWRKKNTDKEIQSSWQILQRLRDGLDYFQICQNGNVVIPETDFDAVAIFTKNSTHLDYVRELMKKGIHILCEKPTVVVTDENHRADREQLSELETIVESDNPVSSQSPRFIKMDAEHYSAKIATIAFYESLGELIAEYGGISKIEAVTKEVDNPDKQRTRSLLCRDNRTGLLLDMGVHLFGVISNIGGNVREIKSAKYSAFPGYDVETYVETEFGIQGNLFHEDATGSFKMIKFIDKLKDPEKDDTKKLRVYLRSKKGIETVVTIDFKEGIVIDSNGRPWYGHSNPKSEEYANVFELFKKAIERGQAPRTNFRRAIQNLDTIYRIYEEFPFEGNLSDVYATAT
ncbi:hypothetical protein GF386_04450 [Candidatus Pacearchaeota archaeon]|nr:hypothetical protein [Candidatus Pacearchaeota archaeon]MBD3283375.1 hypothetical protein [Candidatus Pacearchaeota archaeon]